MRRGKSVLWAAAVAFTIAGLGPSAARGQAGASTPKPAATAATAAQPKEAQPKKDKGDKDDAAPAAKDDKAPGDKTKSDKPAEAGEAGALPPGHPPLDSGLPAGHPPVAGGEDGDGTEAGGNPHAGAMNPRFFQPPPDTAEDDASLPAGTVTVTIKDAQDKPIPNAPITLGILHSSVTKGESSSRLARETDGQGMIRFDALEVGSGVTYRVSTTRGPATYSVAPFALGDKAGKRVTLHSYEVSNDVEDLAVAAQGVVYVSLREDSIQVEHLISVFNLGPVSWAADATFALPAGFKAFNKQDAMDDARVDEVSGVGAALRGTFAPGRHDVSFRYQVPLENEERQSLRIELPPRMAHVRVMVESSKSMGLEVSGFPPAQAAKSREGKRLLVTERQAMRGDDAVQTLDLTVTGLGTKGPGRWIALALAGAALAFGALYMGKQNDDALLDEDTRRDLTEAREALLGELVALERAHKSGEIGPKTYGRLRASLLDALARIVDKLESAREAKMNARKRRREAQAAEQAT